MRHKRISAMVRCTVEAAAAVMFAGTVFAQTPKTWTNAQLINYVQGSWLAKCASGALGGPAEGSGMDTSRGLPALTTGDITNCGNDDIYVQTPFLATCVSKMSGANGIFTASMTDYANAFKATSFGIACGNNVARNALNAGISAPYCGGWPDNGVNRTGNGCGGTPACEDIDWQIECQWVGIGTPCLPQMCVKLDSISGHVIAYANGIAAGTFVDVAMSIAPQYSDIHQLVKAARMCISTQYDVRKNIDSVIAYHDRMPNSTYIQAHDWAFGLNGQTRHTIRDYAVGAKDNLTIVVIALLWGEGSITQTVLWAVRMGEDTDCNCGDAGGIVGAMLGYSNLPQQWRTTFEQAIQGPGCIFSGTGLSGWGFTRFLDSSIAMAKKSILQSGGTYSNGTYAWTTQPVPAPQWFEKRGQNPVFIGNTEVVSTTAAKRSGRLMVHVAVNKSKDLSIRFTVPAEAAGKSMSIDLLDLKGRFVATIVKGTFDAGYHTVTRAALHNLHGRYLARIKAGKFDTTAPVMPVM
jgi:hypothetical protein